MTVQTERVESRAVKHSSSMKSEDRDSQNSSMIDKGPLVKNQREYAFYKEMFSQLIDIVDAIITQITEKVSILPYKVR